MTDEQTNRPGGMPEPRNGGKDDWQRLAKIAAHLALEFLGYLAVLGYAGYRLDERYGWRGRGLFGGLMLAMVAWMYRVVRMSWKLFK